MFLVLYLGMGLIFEYVLTALGAYLGRPTPSKREISDNLALTAQLQKELRDLKEELQRLDER